MSISMQATPLFDSIHHIEDGNPTINQYIANISLNTIPDATLIYEYSVDWLLELKHSENNYKSYRSELTTFLHWAFAVEQISVADITRRNIRSYIDYCCAPPKKLIGYYNVPQFKDDKANGQRVPNALWKPFGGRKINGVELPYKISESALKTKLAILSSYYTFLINEEYTERNPAMMLMKSGRFKSSIQGNASGEDDEEIKSFTDLQWSYVIATANNLADEKPESHKRTLFLIHLLYGCYLRISEVASKPGFSPTMGQFRRDQKTGVWGFFIPRSKGGKRRTVAVSSELLKSLEAYRTYLDLEPLPTRTEETPLFIRHKAASRGSEAGVLNANLGIRQLREEINYVVAQAADLAEKDGFTQDAREMRELTAHSIRHTGISHDININKRPLSHVQADAGHDSIETTSKYLHTTRIERHETAINKPLDSLAESH